MAEALYRKYRPQIFEDVVGQDHIERTIKNAIENDKVSHAYLFTGPRGTGKTTTARLLAKALLCEKGPTPEPDGTCENCQSVAQGTHPDVYELDAASRTGVENVREEIIGRVQFAPTKGRYKVYIIDEVHMLSTAAFNALLKTLEEPPSHVVFILCTTDPQKVPETIHSRCQRFDFHRISVEAMVSRLGAICTEEEVEFEGAALELIAHRAEGGMRNALTSLEQAIAFGEGKVTLATAESLLGSLDSNDLAEIVGAIGTRNVALCFEWTARYVETGADLAQFARDLAEHIRNMYILSLANSDTVLEVDEVIRRELTQEMQYFGPDRLSRMLGVLGDLCVELKTSTNPRLSFEIALTRMVRPDSDLTLESLAERVEALESGYSAVAHVPAQPLVTAAPPTTNEVSPAPTPTVMHNESPAITASQPAPSGQTTSGVDAAPAQNIPSSAMPEVSLPEHEATGASTTQASDVQQSSSQSSNNEDFPCHGGNALNLDNPAALQRIWQAALQIIKKEKAAYSVLLLNTKAGFNQQEGALMIEFSSENVFAFSAVQKPEVMSVIAQAIESAAGSAIPFRIVQSKGEKNGQASAPAPSPSATTAPTTPRPQQAAAPAVQSAQSSTPAHVLASQPVQAQPAQNQYSSPVEDFDSPPIDIYDDYAASLPADDYPSAAPSESIATPAAKSVSDPSTSSDALDEGGIQAMLAKEYGEGVKIDIIEE